MSRRSAHAETSLVERIVLLQKKTFIERQYRPVTGIPGARRGVPVTAIDHRPGGGDRDRRRRWRPPPGAACRRIAAGRESPPPVAIRRRARGLERWGRAASFRPGRGWRLALRGAAGGPAGGARLDREYGGSIRFSLIGRTYHNVSGRTARSAAKERAPLMGTTRNALATVESGASKPLVARSWRMRCNADSSGVPAEGAAGSGGAACRCR